MMPARELLEPREIVQHSRRRLADDGPEPTRTGAGDDVVDALPVDRVAPRELDRRELQLKAARMIDEPVTELAVAHDNARRVEQRDLSADHIVGQRARAEQDLCVRGIHERAQPIAGAAEELEELAVAM